MEKITAHFEQQAENLKEFILEVDTTIFPNRLRTPNVKTETFLTTNALPSDAYACRGGTCTAKRFVSGSGVKLDSQGKLSGVSVNSAPSQSVKELTTTIPNRQVGITTVAEIRKTGGEVIPSGTPTNPYHCMLSGITPQTAEELFTPTIRNPNVK
ncbi:MAG: hypothetical protein DRR19_26120 [Candidatus Parabeggiatoa sp. nov. 1]|nr:MAG: hypothetical protein DRR19_26120 [Gammaproteobacteria bacterium]